MRNISLGLDDYFMLVAMSMVIVSSIVVILAVTKGGVGHHAITMEGKGGLGPHTTYVSFADIEFVLKMIIICQALYGVGLALVKTSMMILYYKLFGSKPTMRIAIYVTGAIVWAWALSIVLESFLLCQPIEFNWNPTLPGGKCGNRNVAFVVAGVLNMVTDLMVMSLPIPYIWKLQLPVGRKVGLTAAFTLGLFVSAISMVRVVSLMHINFADVTYTLPIPLMWSIVEEQVAIVAGNLPFLRRVFSVVLPASWLGSSRRATAGSSKRSENISERTNNKDQTTETTRWSDDGIDGRSDTELASNGAAPDGIQTWKDFRFESTM
ncbi:uncharacterized protein N7498_002969 [Penicillium cinerascens]|uniref:Rhodopsin domain-containing protein n=1 Tax=Penicillium cinerascens TaxID=70096 RepID=A0A9W9NB29_9EURO|nr:uncharacterized protein N7498_002969 [Penicillium cinerascens]KAJ5216562.1 hypothetical protein N7498_002969 [Penicillium cinerascens]